MFASRQTTPPGLMFYAGLWLVGWISSASLLATPANRAALDQYYDRFLARELNKCSTCHLPSERKDPTDLAEFPHNPFGARLRELGKLLSAAGKPNNIAARLKVIADEDADGDGISNQTEILLGRQPGNPQDKPTAEQLLLAKTRAAEFSEFLTTYQWRPFETVRPPAIPVVHSNPGLVSNPIDAFLEVEREAHGLKPRPEAPRETLLRRVYLDLIGLNPSPEEQRAFLNDGAPDAYEKVVNRLLEDPRHGERWGRHWMDVWRYSDWAGWNDGGQVRDSKPHIWRWRDWIVESLNRDKGYDRMMGEMLAADEMNPLDADSLRATGFLVRNYKMLSREQWMEDVVKHTAQAFLGVTLGCAKCHDHMSDPISQAEYYRVRAVFDPHNVRTDRIPGELDVNKAGLVRAFDADVSLSTYLLKRGDERFPDTNHLAAPGIPSALGGETTPGRNGGLLKPVAVKLPRDAVQPERRGFVIGDLLKNLEDDLAVKVRAADAARTNKLLPSTQVFTLLLQAEASAARKEATENLLKIEAIEETETKGSPRWLQAATNAVSAQRKLAVIEARLNHQVSLSQLGEAERNKKGAESARKKLDETAKALAEAEKSDHAPGGTNYQPRFTATYPSESTGRRLAFARWLGDSGNPLTARVAVNHIWLRHFGSGLVNTPSDFGRAGARPSHPGLLDWLAAEFMKEGWRMKSLHRLIVTSQAYRMSSTSEESNVRIDPENIWLWRMNSRRLEAESVRDNLLQAGGSLDLTMGGPEIDHKLGLISHRRSLYFRIAAEKEVEFLKVFDGPAVTECYQRRPSVMPQQALALANSELAIEQARNLARRASRSQGSDAGFIQELFAAVLARSPGAEETRQCLEFLHPRLQPLQAQASKAKTDSGANASVPRLRERLALILLNHSEAVTVR